MGSGDIMHAYIRDFEDFLLQEKNRSENTAWSYVSDVEQFYKYLEDSGVDAENPARINKTNIMSYVLSLSSSGKTASTVSRNISSIKAYFRFLHKRGIIREDVSDGIVPPKVEKVKPEILTHDEVELLLSKTDGESHKALRDKAMLETIYATGIKVSELIDLKMPDIYVELKYIKCGKRERIVPIGEKAASALNDYIEQVRSKVLTDDASLFLNMAGEKMTRQGFWKLIKHYAKIAGITKNITPHTLRHSFAVHLLQNGANLYSVKEMLGHSDISSTQLYLENTQTSLREAYTKAHPRQ